MKLTNCCVIVDFCRDTLGHLLWRNFQELQPRLPLTTPDTQSPAKPNKPAKKQVNSPITWITSPIGKLSVLLQLRFDNLVHLLLIIKGAQCYLNLIRASVILLLPSQVLQKTSIDMYMNVYISGFNGIPVNIISYPRYPPHTQQVNRVWGAPSGLLTYYG